MRNLWIVYLPVLALWPGICSCGSSDGARESSTVGSGAGAGGTGGSGGVGGSGGGTGGSMTMMTGGIFQYPAPLDFTRPVGNGCEVFVAPAGSLCGGASGCPVLLDAEASVGGGARGMTVAGGANDAIYAALRTNALANQHLCFFTLDTSASHVETDPFKIASDPDWISPEWLASDDAGAPHFFFAGASAVAHVSKGPSGWAQEPVSSDTLTEHTLQGIHIGAGGVMSVIYTAHPDEPGYGTLWSLHLATSNGAGYKTDLVFDAAGKYEQPYAALANNDSSVGVVYWARSAPAQPSEVFAWAGGSPHSLFTEMEVLGHAVVAGNDAAGQPIVSSQSLDGIHLFRASAAGAYSDTVVDATNAPKLSGCPDINAQGCMKKTSCTETGDGAFQDHRLERTSDGAVWLVYAERHVDRDFDVKDSCITQGDPACFCNRTLRTDRSTSTLVVASVPDDPSAKAQPRLRAVLGRLGDDATLATSSRGTHLQIAIGHDVASPTVFRYLTVATERL